MPSVTRTGIQFFTNVGAGGSGQETYSPSQDATIEKVTVRFYPGQELSLHLPAIEVKSENGTTKEIVNPTGNKDYFAGDDDYFRFDISVPIKDTDTIVVKYDNTDGVNPYDFIVNMELDRLNGLERVLSKLRGFF